MIPYITDIHTHILPDVDDGSPNIEESILMLKTAISQGITHLFFTSHCFAYMTDKDAILCKKAYEDLENAVHFHNLPIQVFMGSELFCMERYMERILRGLDSGRYLSMNKTRYVLIEFPSWEMEKEEMFSCVEQLLEKNWIPIIAHFERYADTFADRSVVEKLREMGCLIQLNLYSIMEEPMESIRALARDLIHAELIDFIGSDAHNMHHRPPLYAAGLEYIREHCSIAYLNQLLYGNAEKYLLQNS